MTVLLYDLMNILYSGLLFWASSYNRLYQHLEYNIILYNISLVFEKNHGTNSALIEVIDSIYRSLDSGKIVCGVFRS